MATIDNLEEDVLGFYVYLDGNLLDTITDLMVKKYTDTVSYEVSYRFKVSTYNSVGESIDNIEISVFIKQTADPSESIIIYPDAPLSGFSLTVSVDLKDSIGDRVANPPVLLLEISDICSLSYGYECKTSSESQKLLEKPVFVLFTDNQDGTMSASYIPVLAGNYTLSVLQLYQSGLLGNY